MRYDVMTENTTEIRMRKKCHFTYKFAYKYSTCIIIEQNF